MSFQAYLANIQAKTGGSAADFRTLAEEKGFTHNGELPQASRRCYRRMAEGGFPVRPRPCDGNCRPIERVEMRGKCLTSCYFAVLVRRRSGGRVSDAGINPVNTLKSRCLVRPTIGSGSKPDAIPPRRPLLRSSVRFEVRLDPASLVQRNRSGYNRPKEGLCRCAITSGRRCPNALRGKDFTAAGR